MKKYVSHRDIKFDVCAKPTKTSPKSQVTLMLPTYTGQGTDYTTFCALRFYT